MDFPLKRVFSLDNLFSDRVWGCRTMRIETFTTWMFVGFLLMLMGTLLHILGVTEELVKFLGVMGAIYLGIGILLAYLHDKHMIRRTRAGRE